MSWDGSRVRVGGTSRLETVLESVAVYGCTWVLLCMDPNGLEHVATSSDGTGVKEAQESRADCTLRSMFQMNKADCDGTLLVGARPKPTPNHTPDGGRERHRLAVASVTCCQSGAESILQISSNSDAQVAVADKSAAFRGAVATNDALFASSSQACNRRAGVGKMSLRVSFACTAPWWWVQPKLSVQP